MWFFDEATASSIFTYYVSKQQGSCETRWIGSLASTLCIILCDKQPFPMNRLKFVMYDQFILKDQMTKF